jgi:3-hydroxyacyl-CoA dehydrogenase/enoyl-CoA hydratase/3-hydroxybutyryl-CoA epimerase
MSSIQVGDSLSTLRVSLTGGVAKIVLDVPGQAVNIVTRTVRQEFAQLFSLLESDPTVRAAVLLSGKPDSFLAGADIEEFLEWKTAAEAEAASREGQALLTRLERLRFPVVAAIHGACLGGGLETALACAWRIASDHPKTVLGLPEVQLGLIPGAGGTQRLPRTVGLTAALDMILTGRNVRARQAHHMGLVDEVVHPAILDEVATARAIELAQGELRRNAGSARSVGRLLLEATPLGRAVVLAKARKSVLRKTRGLYPAPLAALEVVAKGYRSRTAGLAAEARAFGELAMSSQCRELIFLFFASTAAKKESGVGEPAPEPRPVRKLGVVGAGFMGSGIAALAAQRGTVVRLKDTDVVQVGRGLAAVRRLVSERLQKRHISRQEFADTMALVGGTVDYSGFGTADLVIEAVFEDLSIKHKVFREIENAVPREAVLASNTSTIPIALIARATVHPARVLGMHFFSPVHRMPLLEVIVTPDTDPRATVTAVAYGKALGKTVIVVRDSPGFYVNRILSPYLNEAGRLLDAGASIEAIDNALLDFGFPVGPLTLLDEVGLDIAGKSGAILAEAFGERMAPAPALQAVVAQGRLGRKGGKGFYRYDKSGKKDGPDPAVYSLLGRSPQARFEPGEIQQRCVLALVNEALRCLEEGVINSARDGDLGAVFGFGFPPARGGPFRYVDAVGPKKVRADLEELAERYGQRFAPCDLLVTMAQKGERFYPLAGRPL